MEHAGRPRQFGKSLTTHGDAMIFRGYVTIEGSDFDPQAFGANNGDCLGGRVLERRHLSHKSTAQRLSWESNHVVSANCLEEEILALITRLTPMLNTVSSISTTKISVQVVEELEDSEPPRGIYISASLIKALADLRADFDVDIVQSLRHSGKLTSE